MLKLALTTAFIIFAAVPARSAVILTSCTEDISCVFQGTITVSTTAGHFEAGVSRLALSINAGVTTIPPSNRLETNTFSAASSDFWVSFNYHQALASTTASVQLVGFYDGANVRLGLEGTGNNQEIRLYKRDTTPTKTTLATATGSLCAAATLCKLDIHVVYAVSGSVNVYNNGTLILTYSGDTTTNSATTLNKVYLSGGLSPGGAIRFSQLFVSDSDTRSMKSYTCAPNAAGATQSWTGSVGNVNPNSYNDATFNYTASNNAISQWTPSCTIPSSGTTTVVNVRSYGRFAKGVGGPQNVRFSLDIGTTDYDNGADLSGLTTSFQNFEYDWGANSPATAAPWTPSEINSGFGFGAVSKP